MLPETGGIDFLAHFSQPKPRLHIPEVDMLKQFKIIVEKHPDGYVAYPLGLIRSRRR